MKPKYPNVKRLKALAWITIPLLAFLTACSTPSNPNPNPQPGPPSDISALVIEEVDSPVYDELAKRIEMVPYDGSQKAEDHDLVILDGDAHDPSAVAANPLVSEAVDAGTAVLMVDATGDHKREGLGKYFGFATKEDSPAYLARLGYDENYRAEVRVVEFPSNLEPVFSELPEATPVSVSAPGAVDAFVDRALAAVGKPGLASQQGGYSPYPCGGSNNNSLQASQTSGEVIPAGAIYKHVFYCVPVSWQTGGTNSNKSGKQTPYFDTNYTFTIILDNGNEPQGNFQYVAAQLDVSAVPNGDANGAAPILTNGGSNSNTERGWFQDRITVNLAPADSSLFASVSDSPETANDSTQVQTGFQIGFTGSSDPNITGSYSNSQTVTIPDWTVTNDSAGNAKAWNFKSRNPIDADNPNGAFPNIIGIKDLNGLNTNQLQLHAQSAWKTGSVQTGWVDFTTSTVQSLLDLYWTRDSYGEAHSHVGTGSVGSQPTLSLYMGAVVPVPIESITFAQDPVPVADSAKTTGTITLAAAAPEDITIPLTSSSENAVVPPNVTVSQGDTTATFPVTVTTNGGNPGTTFAAVISAFYAQNYQGAINIKNISPTALQPPTTAPEGYDSQAWIECVGTNGKWVAGYQVRYAVTFVNASGETDRGPWMPFFSGGGYAQPTLIGVPTDPSESATSRNIYRQFLVDYNSSPSAGITKVGTLNDNSTTRFGDPNTAGTTDFGC